MPRQFSVPTLALACLGLAACQAANPKELLQRVQAPPLPQDPLIQVYTNHSPASRYTEPDRHQSRPGDNLEQLLVDHIHSAQSSIIVAVQELRLPRIAQALRERHQAGIQVRVILENTYSQPFSTYSADQVAKLKERDLARYQEARQLMDENGDGKLSAGEIADRDALIVLDNARIPRIDDTAGGGSGSNLMHHKFVLVDDKRVIVTSANFTTSDVHGDFAQPSSSGNANNLVKIDSAELAALFRQEFDLMWGDGPGRRPRFGIRKPLRAPKTVMVGTTPITVHFSPAAPVIPWNQTSNGLIAETLAEAKQSIGLALFVFSDQTLGERLEPIADKGVTIRALIDPSFMYRPYSGGMQMLGASCGPKRQPWQRPITTVGVPRLPPGDLLHHKFAVVDQKMVITGSHNWTQAANHGNDETLLVIRSPVVAAHYQREFERLYDHATLGVPTAIQKKSACSKAANNRPESPADQP
jgi:phosphatidylserine/phosphatidylglycerophosphate/cardiolipin synthase-like enzyme